MQKPTVHQSQIVHQNPWSQVRHHSLTWPNGKPGDYYVYELNDGALIIAIHEGKILTINQYRFPIDEESIEFPMGRIEAGEDPTDAAKRELQEESGIEAKNIEKLGTLYMLNGAVRCQMHIFCATELISSTQSLDDAEQGLEIQWIPLKEWTEMIKNNQIKDGETLAAWAMYTARYGTPSNSPL